MSPMRRDISMKFSDNFKMKFFGFWMQSRLVRKRELKGLFFIAPFLIGFVLFLLIPIIQSLIYSFNDLLFADNGLDYKFVGIENFKRAFLEDDDFRRLLWSSLSSSLTSVPVVVIFSCLVAVFLNKKFPGQGIYQLIFFIPVITASGIMTDLMGGDRVREVIIGASSASDSGMASLVEMDLISAILEPININAQFTDFIKNTIDNILTIINYSGIQILILLMSLKAIPHSLFEASQIEGASAWEAFWKITFPMMIPQFTVAVFYSIIDSFLRNNNDVMMSIRSWSYSKLQFGYAASLSWIYFVIIIAILGIVMFLLSRLNKHYFGEAR